VPAVVVSKPAIPVAGFRVSGLLDRQISGRGEWGAAIGRRLPAARLGCAPGGRVDQLGIGLVGDVTSPVAAA